MNVFLSLRPRPNRGRIPPSAVPEIARENFNKVNTCRKMMF